VAAAALVVCLSRSDADHIRTHLMPGSADAQQPQVSAKGYQSCSGRCHTWNAVVDLPYVSVSAR
jgi:hypothetical protein